VGQAVGMPQPGDVIAGRYRIERTLSSGGMGFVYVARHTQTGRPFALKVMHKDLTGDEEAERRFMREAKLCSSITHPCVIRVYDIGRHDDNAYMVMELLEGETLGERLKRGRLPVDEATALLCRVIDGVAAAHALGIVHRDLKPDNIFLCRSPDGQSLEPKVLDFGISKSLNSNATQNLTRTGIALGTPLYMSPEQVHGERDIDQRADVYALGVILYEMLSGGVPFSGRSYADLVLKIITGHCKSLLEIDPSLPSGLDSVTRKAMAINRMARHANVRELGSDLQAFAASTVTTELRISQVSSAARGIESLTPFTTEATRASRPEIPRKRDAMIALAALATLAAAAGALWLTRAPETQVAQDPLVSPAPVAASTRPHEASPTGVSPHVIANAPAVVVSTGPSTPLPVVDPLRTSVPPSAASAAGAATSPAASGSSKPLATHEPRRLTEARGSRNPRPAHDSVRAADAARHQTTPAGNVLRVQPLATPAPSPAPGDAPPPPVRKPREQASDGLRIGDESMIDPF
jgi:serine/threonine protein kinase